MKRRKRLWGRLSTDSSERRATGRRGVGGETTVVF